MSKGFALVVHILFAVHSIGFADDVNECESPGTCSQICNNTEDGYECSCRPGYNVVPSNRRRCEAQERGAAVFISDGGSIHRIDLQTKESTVVVSGLTGSDALDYDFSTQTLFWSCNSGKAISSAPIETGSPITVFIREVKTVDGLAVDWIHGHIYWTDTGKNTIELADLEGNMRKTLISESLDEPRAIVLDPFSGWMYWSDWGTPAKIERAGMDGSHRNTIITARIRWPNGLAIDFLCHRIYCADAFLDLLWSADYDGTNQRVIISSPTMIKHPFALDIFEDWLYWSDWRSKKIHRVDKFTGQQFSDIASDISDPDGMKIFHRYKQLKVEGDNHCAPQNGNCSHLCLPAPRLTNLSPGFSCACPDDMKLTSDNKTCSSTYVNECEDNNGGCSQQCVDTLEGFRCECNEGYTLVRNKECEDINECETPGSCSQHCNNTIGGFECSCHPGYSLVPPYNRSCKAQGSDPIIFISVTSAIDRIDLKTLGRTTVVRDLGNTRALDYDFSTETLFWSDNTKKIIGSAPMEAGSPVTVLISDNVRYVDGVAVDWIHRHIYWTDQDKDTIEVADLNGHLRKTLISTDLSQPRAIVLNPFEGWMFWSDWERPAKIERSGMDGSNRSTIITSNVKWPNGLAIDLICRKIYCIDGDLSIIWSADYDGSNQHIILSSPTQLKHPFALDVFEDWLYWSDWRTNSVQRVNKFTGKNISDIATGLVGPDQLRVFHKYKQQKDEGDNHCAPLNRNCSHLCLPAPKLTDLSPGYSCACPDGMNLMNDGKTCTSGEINECEGNNGGCAQRCVDTEDGFYCECNDGYNLVDDKECEDVNECETPGTCSQICNNTDGGFECSCLPGYDADPLNNHRCKAQGNELALFVSDRRLIRRIDLQIQEITTVVRAPGDARALDYDFHTGTLFWSDNDQKRINSAPMRTGSPVAVLISANVEIIDGIALDWIHGHIYWTDVLKNTIEVAGVNGENRKTLISYGIDQPRAIVLNPLEGWVYWSDWGIPAKIERAGMDGSHRSTIITTLVKWPNGLAIDFVSKRIYCVDATLNILWTADYDGNNQRIILHSSTLLKHPYGLDVFEDWLYWTDWISDAIHRVNKFTGEELSTIARNLDDPNELRVFHSYKQPKGEGDNHCGRLNRNCSHLCLPAPKLTDLSPGYSCACPDGMDLMDDGKTCTSLGASAAAALPITSAFTTNTALVSKQNRVTQSYSKPSDVVVTDRAAANEHFSGQVSDDVDDHSENLTGIIIGSVAILAVVLPLFGYCAYKYYLRRNIESTDFDSPVYKKTAEDELVLVKKQYQPGQSSPSGSEPLISSGANRNFYDG